MNSCKSLKHLTDRLLLVLFFPVIPRLLSLNWIAPFVSTPQIKSFACFSTQLVPFDFLPQNGWYDKRLLIRKILHPAYQRGYEERNQ
jgi:hypothetical protein